jgi:hypothetical protein
VVGIQVAAATLSAIMGLRQRQTSLFSMPLVLVYIDYLIDMHPALNYCTFEAPPKKVRALLTL